MITDNYKYIGEHIKTFRKQKHMTQAELAEKAGITQSKLSNYEKAKTLPRYDTLLKISRALDVNYTDILGYKADPKELELYYKTGIDPEIYYEEPDFATVGFDENDLEFYNQLEKELAKENITIKQEVPTLSDVINALHQLNELGLLKVYEYINDLTASEKHTKKA